VNIKGLSEQKVLKIQQAAKEKVGMGFLCGGEALQKQETECFHISTGSENVDMIMNGGFRSRCISEIFGAGASNRIGYASVMLNFYEQRL
jgi:RecA/RadA recombinase